METSWRLFDFSLLPNNLHDVSQCIRYLVLDIWHCVRHLANNHIALNFRRVYTAAREQTYTPTLCCSWLILHWATLRQTATSLYTDRPGSCKKRSTHQASNLDWWQHTQWHRDRASFRNIYMDFWQASLIVSLLHHSVPFGRFKSLNFIVLYRHPSTVVHEVVALPSHCGVSHAKHVVSNNSPCHWTY